MEEKERERERERFRERSGTLRRRGVPPSSKFSPRFWHKMYGRCREIVQAQTSAQGLLF
jgi:hypothetical protein